jgi:hypothetical protein
MLRAQSGAGNGPPAALIQQSDQKTALACHMDDDAAATCQYRLKIPHSAGRKGCHPPEKMVYSFSRLIENGTGW